MVSVPRDLFIRTVIGSKWYRSWQCTDGLDLASVGYNPAAEPTAAVINAVKFDYTWMGAILGVVILVIVLLLDVEKYADQYNS